MNQVRRAALLFSGGPAPGANAVIQAAVMSLRRAGVEALGIRNGYTELMEFDGGSVPASAWFLFKDEHLRGLRSARGVLIGTARAHPGKGVRGASDLVDKERSAGLRRTLAALASLGVDALVSIGGDGTLRTAAMLHRLQQVDPELPRVRIVHLPKTIDNDYRGIDYTFGFFTAVGTIANELLNLRADALATGSCFIVECMGRRAGWLSYGAAVAGEAHLVVGVEDIVGDLAMDEAGAVCLNLEALIERIVELLVVREAKGRSYATVVLAEGLAERLPASLMSSLPRDEHGVYGFAQLQLSRMVARAVAERYRARTGAEKKVTGVQIGYETRCAVPHAFDVLLGCQLGVGASRALCELGHDGVMISVSGQMDLRYVPFADLVDAETLSTEVRYITPGSDFHRLAHALGTRVPGRG